MRERIINWLNSFIEVALELSVVTRETLLSGQAQIVAPLDIVKIMYVNGVIFEGKPGNYYFAYAHSSGPVIINVISEPNIKRALQIKIQERQ
jgi:hypothetical protein